jgi:hypothetical protein
MTKNRIRDLYRNFKRSLENFHQGINPAFAKVYQSFTITFALVLITALVSLLAPKALTFVLLVLTASAIRTLVLFLLIPEGK